MTDAYGSDIYLPGWADQSIWGYDPLLECYWTQLWRDEDRTDRPRIWISSFHLIPTLDLLVRLAAEAVDHPVDDQPACQRTRPTFKAAVIAGEVPTAPRGKHR